MQSLSISKEIVLESKNLFKKFGDLVAVDNVSFSIEKGTIVGILGPNGAGKTTTIRLITGIFELSPKTQIKIFSSDFSDSPNQLKRQFGIVPEISNAYSDFTLWQNLMFAGAIYGLSKTNTKKRAQELLTQFKLLEKKTVKTKSLSKGLKQRLNLCLALIHDPPILILDEPLSGLDPISVNIVRNRIVDLKDQGKTILLTTHNMQEAQRICDRVLIINKGKILADQTPDKLLKKIKPASKIIFNLENPLSDSQSSELKHKFSSIQFTKQMENRLVILSQNPLEDIYTAKKYLEKENHTIRNFKLKDSTLEEVFIDIIEKDAKNNPKTNPKTKKQ